MDQIIATILTSPPQNPENPIESNPQNKES